jgi:hypothetical protein
MWVIGIGRKIDIRKWCPFTILGWWRRSNSGNVGPVWEYISIYSDSKNNSSDSFIRIDFLPLKRYAPSSTCVPLGLWDDLSIHQSDSPTIENMSCETPKTFISYRWSPCHQAHGHNFAAYVKYVFNNPSNSGTVLFVGLKIHGEIGNLSQRKIITNSNKMMTRFWCGNLRIWWSPWRTACVKTESKWLM